MDWLKHSFIAKYNQISSISYKQFALILLSDATKRTEKLVCEKEKERERWRGEKLKAKKMGKMEKKEKKEK